MSSAKAFVFDILMRHMRARRRRAGPEGTIELMREQVANGQRIAPKPPTDEKVTPIDAGGVPAEWVERGASRARRVILYLHGGGYCVGSPETHRPMVSKLCEQAHARALVMDYRLGPDHPFPAAFEDGLRAYRWLLTSGVDPAGIVIAGDSAGGGLALAVAMGIRAGGLSAPAAIVCLSPWADLALGSRSLLTQAKTDAMLDIMDLAIFSQAYMNGQSPGDWRASPVYGDFKGLPSLLIHAGARECLKDDALRVAAAAEAAGVDVSIEVWEKMGHVFQALPLPQADAALSRIGSFIRSRTSDPALTRARPAPAGFTAAEA